MVICAEYSSGVRLLCVSRLIPIPCSETLRSTVEVSPSKQAGVSWSAVWCRCVLVQFGHSLALVAVGPPVPVRILHWTCHTPSVEDATSFLCAVCLFQAFKKVKRQFLHPFLCAYSDICLCSVCCVLSSFCVITRLYCTVHAYSAFPI